MSNDLVALILDIVVLVFLGATMIYVWRLFKSLNDFKQHRREFDSVITNLLSSIDQAERSVQTLKQVSAQEAGELERLIRQSKSLSDELKIINEAGENMAKRLESLAEKNREIVQSSRGGLAVGKNRSNDDSKISSPVHRKRRKNRDRDYESTLKTVDKPTADSEPPSELPSFMIQDREFEDMESLESHLDSSKSNDVVEDDDIPDDLQSEAEKELFAALRTSKKDVSRRRRS